MQPKQNNSWIWAVIIVAGLVWMSKGGGCDSFAPPVKIDRVTYVYEKDNTAIPSAVSAALNALNTQGIMANHHEQDTKDGTGDVPEQYKIALPAAIAAGLPSLVVQSGTKVVRVVQDPKTYEQVIEAAK